MRTACKNMCMQVCVWAYVCKCIRTHTLWWQFCVHVYTLANTPAVGLDYYGERYPIILVWRAIERHVKLCMFNRDTDIHSLHSSEKRQSLLASYVCQVAKTYQHNPLIHDSKHREQADYIIQYWQELKSRKEEKKRERAWVVKKETWWQGLWGLVLHNRTLSYTFTHINTSLTESPK